MWTAASTCWAWRRCSAARRRAARGETLTRPLLLLLAGPALALGVAPVRAQEEKEAPEAAAEEPGAPAPGEMRVRAESYEQVEKGHFTARGPVDLSVAGMRILADRADVFEEEQPDGSVKRRMVAEGNVVFIRGEERLSGDRLEVDEQGRGVFLNAVGYVEPGVFVEGRKIERVDDQTYRVEGGKFTSCAQANPRWSFSASRARIDVGDKIVATNALFKIKSVPALYLPWVYYPIRRDGRSTGFLFPHFGHSSTRGFTIGSGFFWAMNRSWDQTFYADSYSEIGYGFGHELRYAQRAPSRGTFRTYVLAPRDGAELDYDLDWNALQLLPGKTRAAVQVRQYSNLLFQQRFQDNFNLATTRTQRWAGSLESDLGVATLRAYADSTTTYFGTSSTRVNGHVPGIGLRRYPRLVGLGGLIVGFEATADRLVYGTEDSVDRYPRFDFAPTVSRPMRLSFLQLTPQLGYRYTRYGTSHGVAEVDEEEVSALIGPPLNRSFFEASADLRGPTFSRVFDTPGGSYSERFKHVIGPEITWTYRTRVDDFSAIPKFDGLDYLLGTNQIAYSLVQRFLAKRRGPGGRTIPYEFFTWRLMQTYYVQIAEGQSNFDPNYSSSAFGPGFRPEHFSPLMSRMRLRPTPDFSLDFHLEYDVNFEQVRRHSILGSLNQPRFNVQGGWSRSVRLSEDPSQRVVVSESLRGSAAIDLLPRRLHLEGGADYDMVNRIFWQVRGQLRYSVQCCGFRVEVIQYNWNGRNERQWNFRLELANVGSMGNFMGQDTIADRQGLAGYR